MMILGKKFKSDHTNKWYIYNLELVLENEMHKILWDFEIQTDHLILARWPNRVIDTPPPKKEPTE